MDAIFCTLLLLLLHTLMECNDTLVHDVGTGWMPKRQFGHGDPHMWCHTTPYVLDRSVNSFSGCTSEIANKLPELHHTYAGVLLQQPHP